MPEKLFTNEQREENAFLFLYEITRLTGAVTRELIAIGRFELENEELDIINRALQNPSSIQRGERKKFYELLEQMAQTMPEARLVDFNIIGLLEESLSLIKETDNRIQRGATPDIAKITRVKDELSRLFDSLRAHEPETQAEIEAPPPPPVETLVSAFREQAIESGRAGEERRRNMDDVAGGMYPLGPGFRWEVGIHPKTPAAEATIGFLNTGSGFFLSEQTPYIAALGRFDEHSGDIIWIDDPASFEEMSVPDINTLGDLADDEAEIDLPVSGAVSKKTNIIPVPMPEKSELIGITIFNSKEQPIKATVKRSKTGCYYVVTKRKPAKIEYRLKESPETGHKLQTDAAMDTTRGLVYPSRTEEARVFWLLNQLRNPEDKFATLEAMLRLREPVYTYSERIGRIYSSLGALKMAAFEWTNYIGQCSLFASYAANALARSGEHAGIAVALTVKESGFKAVGHSVAFARNKDGRLFFADPTQTVTEEMEIEENNVREEEWSNAEQSAREAPLLEFLSDLEDGIAISARAARDKGDPEERTILAAFAPEKMLEPWEHIIQMMWLYDSMQKEMRGDPDLKTLIEHLLPDIFIHHGGKKFSGEAEALIKKTPSLQYLNEFNPYADIANSLCQKLEHSPLVAEDEKKEALDDLLEVLSRAELKSEKMRAILDMPLIQEHLRAGLDDAEVEDLLDGVIQCMGDALLEFEDRSSLQRIRDRAKTVGLWFEKTAAHTRALDPDAPMFFHLSENREIVLTNVFDEADTREEWLTLYRDLRLFAPNAAPRGEVVSAAAFAYAYAQNSSEVIRVMDEILEKLADMERVLEQDEQTSALETACRIADSFRVGASHETLSKLFQFELEINPGFAFETHRREITDKVLEQLNAMERRREIVRINYSGDPNHLFSRLILRNNDVISDTFKKITALEAKGVLEMDRIRAFFSIDEEQVGNALAADIARNVRYDNVSGKLFSRQIALPLASSATIRNEESIWRDRFAKRSIEITDPGYTEDQETDEILQNIKTTHPSHFAWIVRQVKKHAPEFEKAETAAAAFASRFSEKEAYEVLLAAYASIRPEKLIRGMAQHHAMPFRMAYYDTAYERDDYLVSGNFSPAFAEKLRHCTKEQKGAFFLACGEYFTRFAHQITEPTREKPETMERKRERKKWLAPVARAIPALNDFMDVHPRFQPRFLYKNSSPQGGALAAMVELKGDRWMREKNEEMLRAELLRETSERYGKELMNATLARASAAFAEGEGTREKARGKGTEFVQYRPYAPGDDAKRIDWKTYGRTDKYFIKEQSAETQTPIRLCVDVEWLSEIPLAEGKEVTERAKQLLSALLNSARKEGGQPIELRFFLFGEQLFCFSPLEIKEIARHPNDIRSKQFFEQLLCYTFGVPDGIKNFKESGPFPENMRQIIADSPRATTLFLAADKNRDSALQAESSLK